MPPDSNLYTVLALAPAHLRGVQTDLTPTSVAVTFLARDAGQLDLNWRIDHAFADGLPSKTVASGTFAAPPTAAPLSIPFTPPGFGSYAVTVAAVANGVTIRSAAVLLAVTPVQDPLPATFGDPSGTGEIDLIAWMRLGRVRLSTKDGAAALAQRIAYAKSKGVAFIIAFTNLPDFTPANVTAFAQQFPGETWEAVNEPDLIGGLSIASYVSDHLAPCYAALKAADPTATLIGPAFCVVLENSLNQFVAAGGFQHVDQFSTHAYQGNEDDDYTEWRLAFGTEVQNALAAAGKPDMVKWVTERDFAGVYGGATVWTVQCAYVLWHTNYLDMLGVPLDRNLYYYAEDVGYYQVPSWLYGNQGMMPAALALRFRGQLLGTKTLTHTLDFGPTLNQCFVGFVHADATAQVVTLFNTGTTPTPVTFDVPAGTTALDAWGNGVPLSIANGQATVTLSVMPTYLIPPVGSTVTVATPAWPTVNLLAGATLTTTAAPVSGWGPASLVTSAGPLQTPLGDGGELSAVWAADGSSLPQTVTFTLGQPATATRCIVFGEFADNVFCCPLSYDVQALVDGAWVTLSSFDAQVPPAWPGKTPYANLSLPNNFVQSYGATCFGLHTFPATTASEWRLNVRAVSTGLHTDFGLATAVPEPGVVPLINLRRMMLFA